MKKCGCFSVFSHSLSDPPGRRRGPDAPRFWKTPGLGASESEVGRSGEVATVRAFRSGRSLDYRVHALLLGQAEVKTTRIEPWSKMIFRFLIERFVNFPKIWWMLHRVYMTDVTTDFLFQLLHREWPGPCWDQKTSIMLIAWNSGHIMGYFFQYGFLYNLASRHQLSLPRFRSDSEECKKRTVQISGRIPDPNPRPNRDIDDNETKDLGCFVTTSLVDKLIPKCTFSVRLF